MSLLLRPSPASAGAPPARAVRWSPTQDSEIDALGFAHPTLWRGQVERAAQPDR